jgi:uncharacterized protein (TIGR03663 family)
MTRPAAIAWISALICATALALRLPALSARPMHADEAVQAVRFVDFLTGHYHYDPNEYHGPAMYLFAAPVALLQGKTTLASLNETDLRIVPVLLGIATILLLLLLRDALGTPAIVIAAVFIAISPAFTFYNRYFIHESLLVFLTLATLTFLWRYRQHPRLGWALAAGASFALLYATKTTWIIAAAAAVGAAVITILWQRYAPPVRTQHHAQHTPPPGRWCHLLAAAGIFAVIVVLLFSDFFTHPRGIVDSILAFGPYIGRGLGQNADASAHVHPWYFHLQTLLYTYTPGPRVNWSAWLIHPPAPIWSHAFLTLLALIGSAAAFRRREIHGIRMGILRFLVVFTLLQWTIYSAIPYKTPWLILTPLLFLTLLAGVGMLVLWQYFSRWHARTILVAVLLAGLANLEWQAYTANFIYSSDPKNPFVYGHTSKDIFTLLDSIRVIAAVHPKRDDMLIRVFGQGTWPLPWYLRHYPNVGYWQEVPTDSDPLRPLDPLDGSPIIITTAEFDEPIRQRLHQPYVQRFFGLRPGVILVTYTRKDLLDAFIAQQRIRSK